MSDAPFIGPSYNLDSRPASVQRTVNLMPVPLEPGNERAGWVFRDVPGLVAMGQIIVIPPVDPEDPDPDPHTCTTGPSWAQTVKTNHRHTGVYYLNDRFISPYEATGSVAGGVSYSLNGTTWLDANAFPSLTGVDHISAVCFGNGIYVAYFGATRIWQSADAITWTLGTGNPIASKQSSPGGIWFGNGLFVIPCASARVLSSANASSMADHFPPYQFWTGTYAFSKHYGCRESNGDIYTSTDLDTWTLKGTAYALGKVGKLVANSSVMMAIDRANQTTYIARSVDQGATWTAGTGLPVSASFYKDLLYVSSQAMWILTDEDGACFLSFDDGATWTQAASDLFPFLGANIAWQMAVHPDGFLYVGVPITSGLSSVAAVGTC